MKLLPPSLQRRLLVLLLGLASAAWLLAATVNSIYSMRRLDELLDRHLEQAAAVLIGRQVGDVDAPALVGTLMQGTRADRVAFQVWHQGTLALRSTNAPAEPMSSSTHGFETRRLLGKDWRVYSTTVNDELRIYVGERVEARNQILYTVVRSALWTLSIALPLLALAGWWSVRRGLAPLRQLVRAIAGRRPESLEAIRLNEPLAELQPVVGALNHLFERIANLLEAERRFTADAAHELRTPIAAIRVQAEVARGAADPSERLRAIEQTLAGCDHARHLVEQLLTMARLEAETAPVREPFDLSALVRQVAAQVAPAALDRRQSLVLEAAEPLTARGDVTLIGLLVRNLLDNAVRYSPDGAMVRATVERQDQRACLTVEDSGPGLTEQQRARLGERFFRVLGTNQSGSGLGWSIVRWIAQVHELNVSTDVSPQLGGLRVRVCWTAP
jgi:two-component system sensor histidine kinase QseC